MAVITRYCRIKGFSLREGERVIYENTAVSLDQFCELAFRHLDVAYPKFYKMDRMSKLGVLGAELLLKDSKVAALKRESVSVVLSNANASLDTDRRYFETMKSIPSPALFVYTLSNIVTGEICIRHGFKGENAFFVTPVFSPTTMALYVDAVLRANGTEACLAGWVDVLGDQHDVFLYLVERSTDGERSWPHNAETLEKLYLS